MLIPETWRFAANAVVGSEKNTPIAKIKPQKQAIIVRLRFH
jgi:hypothetical protein